MNTGAFSLLVDNQKYFLLPLTEWANIMSWQDKKICMCWSVILKWIHSQEKPRPTRATISWFRAWQSDRCVYQSSDRNKLGNYFFLFWSPDPISGTTNVLGPQQLFFIFDRPTGQIWLVTNLLCKESNDLVNEPIGSYQIQHLKLSKAE